MLQIHPRIINIKLLEPCGIPVWINKKVRGPSTGMAPQASSHHDSCFADGTAPSMFRWGCPCTPASPESEWVSFMREALEMVLTWLWSEWYIMVNSNQIYNFIFLLTNCVWRGSHHVAQSYLWSGQAQVLVAASYFHSLFLSALHLSSCSLMSS